MSQKKRFDVAIKGIIAKSGVVRNLQSVRNQGFLQRSKIMHRATMGLMQIMGMASNFHDSGHN